MVKVRAISTVKRNLEDYLAKLEITLINTGGEEDAPAGILIPLQCLDELDTTVIANNFKFNPRASINRALDSLAEATE